MDIGAATGGLLNGTMAALNGRNFWNGDLPAFGRGVFSFNNTPTIPAPANIENKSFTLQNLQRPSVNADPNKTIGLGVNQDLANHQRKPLHGWMIGKMRA